STSSGSSENFPKMKRCTEESQSCVRDTWHSAANGVFHNAGFSYIYGISVVEGD
ncbi:unnamed protein product, partial [Prunus brigantina]